MISPLFYIPLPQSKQILLSLTKPSDRQAVSGRGCRRQHRRLQRGDSVDDGLCEQGRQSGENVHQGECASGCQG